ncbi:hypothetical protein D3C86_1086010 [compost metagenome]
MVQARDDRLAAADQARQDHGGAGAQVGGLDRGSRELGHPLDHRHVALGLDVGAHADQLVHVQEAVLEDHLGQDRGAVDGRKQGHDLRLHVGGEAGVGHGADVDRLEGPVDLDVDHVLAHGGDGHAHLDELACDRLQVVVADPGQGQVAPGDGRGDHEGARLDPVGDDRVVTAAQAADALDGDGLGAGPGDLGAHLVEEVGEIDDLGLLGAVLDDGGALGVDRGHHDGLGGAHAREVEVHVAADQSVGLGLHVAVLDGDLGAKGA